MEIIPEKAPSHGSEVELPLAWAWKLEYPLRPALGDGSAPLYKLAIWCSAENSVRSYGAERAAKIIAPELEQWLLVRASELDGMQPPTVAGGYGVEATIGRAGKRRASGWRGRR